MLSHEVPRELALLRTRLQVRFATAVRGSSDNSVAEPAWPNQFIRPKFMLGDESLERRASVLRERYIRKKRSGNIRITNPSAIGDRVQLG